MRSFRDQFNKKYRDVNHKETMWKKATDDLNLGEDKYKLLFGVH